MRKLFFLLLALVATTALWAYDFEVDGLYYKKCTKDGLLSVNTDTIGWNIPAEAITVAEAREICAGLASEEKTSTKYYVMGYVRKIHSKHADGVANYGNAQFYMEDVKGANSFDDFMAYQVYGPNAQKLTDPNCVAVGDFVVIYGELTNYNGTYETVGRGSAYIWKSSNPLLGGSTQPQEPEELVIPEEAKAWNIPAEAIDVMKAREICSGLAAGDSTDKPYYVMGYVKKLHANHVTGVSDYGNAQFYMENIKGKNSTNDFIAFQVYGINGTKINNPDAVAVGDFVVVYGKLTNFMGNTYETLGKGSACIWKSTNPLIAEVLPDSKEVSVFEEFLDSKSSFEKFTAKSILGDATWRAPAAKNNFANISKQEQYDDTTHYVVVTYQSLDSNNYADISMVNIPAKVEHEGVIYDVIGIGYHAFRHTYTIPEITIPENIKSIGDNAFSSSINSLSFESPTPPVVASYTFCEASPVIYVPCGSVPLYQEVFNPSICNSWEAEYLWIQEYPTTYSISVSASEHGSVPPLSTADLTICGVHIEAHPDDGYHFVQWSDGNTDNPRTLVLTQDTILTAEFAFTINGQCGDNLYWNYDQTNKTLSITGYGKMYDYTPSTQPWYFFKEEILKLITSPTTTSLGTSAFAGCIRLGEVTLGANMEYLYEDVFADCDRLYHIYCYPSYTPFAKQSSFSNYNVYLHVPCESYEMYNLDKVFGNFKYIECLGSEQVETEPDSIIIQPSTNDVTITWPTEDDAETYSIVITKDGEVFCTLTFNKDGQLLNIAFAPSRDGQDRAQYAELTTKGLRFTVTGLESGTNYDYTITTKDSSDQTISTYSGEFTTQSDVNTSVSDSQSPMANCQKLLRNGQLIILRDGVEYNAMGQEIQ